MLSIQKQYKQKWIQYVLRHALLLTEPNSKVKYHIASLENLKTLLLPVVSK